MKAINREGSAIGGEHWLRKNQIFIAVLSLILLITILIYVYVYDVDTEKTGDRRVQLVSLSFVLLPFFYVIGWLKSSRIIIQHPNRASIAWDKKNGHSFHVFVGFRNTGSRTGDIVSNRVMLFNAAGTLKVATFKAGRYLEDGKVRSFHTITVKDNEHGIERMLEFSEIPVQGKLKAGSYRLTFYYEVSFKVFGRTMSKGLSYHCNITLLESDIKKLYNGNIFTKNETDVDLI